MKKDVALGGVTRVPGGAVSSDGDLCAAVDVCNDGMGLEMLERPTLLFELSQGENLLCIHEPEGEEKHYVTQYIVPVTPVGTRQVVPSIVGGDDIGDDTGGFIDDRDYGGGGTSGGGGGGASGGSSSGTSGGYTPPTGTFTDANASAMGTYYTNVIATEEAARLEDSGGTDAETATEGHIYLCYYKEVSGQYSRQQMIDITPYGKVTAIQPMGNTLICNHEGTDSYAPEIRYYLWKPDNTTTVEDVEVADPKYIGLGAKPPMVNITFGLKSTFEYWPKTESTLNDNTTPTKYTKYGGVKISSYLYTDTVPVWWSKYKNLSYVPPYDIAITATHNESTGGNNDYGYSYNGSDEAVTSSTLRSEHFSMTYSIDGVTSPDGKTDVAGTKVNWTTMALASYNKFIAEQHNVNKFVFPFYIRYAYELYDGSLIMHSYPVLMTPNSRGPVFALDGKWGLSGDLDDNTQTYEKVRLEFMGRTYGFSSKLMHDIAALASDDLARLKNWKDLIRGLNIYVTPPIYNYNQGGQVLGWHSMSEHDPANNGKNRWDGHYTVGKYVDGSTTVASGNVSMTKAFEHVCTSNYKIFWPYNNTATNAPGYCLTVPQKDEKEVMELHENAGQFYKLISIEFEKLVNKLESGESDTEVVIGKKVLNTIANQDIMQDDNGSHDKISAEVLYGYNRRLNMAQVLKQMHPPLLPQIMWAKDYYMSSSTPEQNKWQVNIYAKNGGRAALVKTTSVSVNTRWPNYVFYPNTNATEAVLIHGSIKYKVRLREHKALNGMFWIGDFLNGFDDLKEYQLAPPATFDASAVLSPSNINRIVDESNKIYTTATDNPFYVPFGNINIAGGGEVRALCSATQAMSQGQFGQHPMYCFTSEGVWAMTVSDTGGWATIQPVTRDVISEGTMPLSLDSTVVFLTERGLLQLAGAQIKVLSDVLQGADPLILNTPEFGLNKLTAICNATGTGNAAGDAGLIAVAKSLADNKFPEHGHLAYDYDNARIYVTPQNGSGSWVYNLKSQIWTQASTALDRQIVSYPECEAQCGGKVVKISVDRAVLGNLCTKGLVLSRPIKLADMGLLKRWREMVVRGRFKPYGVSASDPYGRTASPCVVQCALWGTRDWINSALVASSTSNRLTRWGGSPYFAHSVGLFLVAPTPSGALTPAWPYAVQVSGLDADVDAEHDNKLR